MDATGTATGGSARARLRHAARLLPWLLSPLLYPLFHAVAAYLPAPLTATAAFLLVVLLPGWFLLHGMGLRGGVDLPGRVARAFILGVAIVAALGLIAWYRGGDTGLGPVPARDAPPPPFPGRLSAIVWGEAAFLTLGALGLMLWRGWRGAPLRPATKERGRKGGGREESRGIVFTTLAESPLPVDESESPWQRIQREAYRLGEQHQRVRTNVSRGTLLLVLGTILLLAAGLAFYAGGNFGRDTDSPAHIACVREMVERDRILPRTAFYADGDGASVDPRFGFFHVALAATAQLGRLDAARLWDLLPGILAPFALLVFYAFARRVLRGESPALFATFLMLLCFGDAGRGILARIAYGNFMGIALTWGVLALAMHFALGDTRRTALWLIALGAFAAVATHVFSAAAILFSLGVFLLAVLLVRGFRHAGVARIAYALGAAAAGILLPLVWRFRYASASLNPLHTESQGLLYLSKGLYVIQPGLWWPYLGVVGLVGAALGLLLWRRVREGDAEVYLAALSLAPFLVLLNPLATPLFEASLGYLVARLASLVPFILVLAYWMRVAGQNVLELTSRRRVAYALLYCVLLGWLLVPRVEAFTRSYGASHLKAMRGRSVLLWENLLRRVDAELEAPAVVLSDPLTSYALPAFTRHSTVAVLHQHGSPADSLGLDRLAACRDVLSPYLGTGEKARACRRFGVEYVLVNTTLPRAIDLFFCHVDPTLAWQQRRALEEDRALFARVADYGAKGALFRVRRERLDALCGIVTPGEEVQVARTTAQAAESILLRALPATARPVPPDTTAGITLAAVELGAPRAARGDSVAVTLYWRRVGGAPRVPAVTQLAIETRAPRGPLASAALSRVDRILVQQRRHRLYRHRTPSSPLRGAFGIEHWPRDRFVVDRTWLAVPPRAAPGMYAVKVSWEDPIYLPNARLPEYLSDAAAHPGIPIGSLEVY